VTETPGILFCNCTFADVIAPEVKREVLRHLCESNRPFHAVSDLCGLAARKDPVLKKMADAGDITLVACHPRAVKWLFHAGGAPLPDAGAVILDMREATAAAVIQALPPGAAGGRDPADRFASISSRLESPPDGWKPWFPVIDHDRCTNCGKCLTFCLFDVFGVDERKNIFVKNEAGCKTDCPACARVCPEVAIMFPKYGKGPINGDAVREEDMQREGMKVDVSSLLGGDLYGVLRDRTRQARKRFSTEQDEARALRERKQCLQEIQEKLDIPDEVLMALPAEEDIRDRIRKQTRDAAPPTEDDWGI